MVGYYDIRAALMAESSLHGAQFAGRAWDVRFAMPRDGLMHRDATEGAAPHLPIWGLLCCWTLACLQMSAAFARGTFEGFILTSPCSNSNHTFACYVSICIL